MKISDDMPHTLAREGSDLASNQKLLQALAYSRSGTMAAAGNIDGVVFLYDMQTREYKARFANHSLAVRALSFDRTSTSLISAG